MAQDGSGLGAVDFDYGKPTRVIMWRHGQTPWNLEGRFQGSLDIPLTERGLEQASESARRLAALQPDAVIASDLQRAWRTAEKLADLVGLEVHQDARLRETHAGVFEGVLGKDLPERFPEMYEGWRSGDIDEHIGGGESRREVAARMAEALEAAADSVPAGGLAVVTAHGGCIRLGMAAVLGFPLEIVDHLGILSNCNWSVLQRKESGSWQLLEHNTGTLPEPVTVEEG